MSIPENLEWSGAAQGLDPAAERRAQDERVLADLRRNIDLLPPWKQAESRRAIDRLEEKVRRRASKRKGSRPGTPKKRRAGRRARREGRARRARPTARGDDPPAPPAANDRAQAARGGAS
jgi:hypothetical protein